MKKLIIILGIFLVALWAGSTLEAAIVVGRISHIEGEIYRYMDVDNSWAATQLQSPAGIEDVLATGTDSRAEIIFPNGMLVRLDEKTEIEILELEDDLGVLVLSSGLARFYNRSGSGELLIETARGTATIGPGSVLDMQADSRSVTVSSVAGTGTFQSVQNGVERLEIISGATSLEFREETLVAGGGPLRLSWDMWCAAREEVWARNRLVRSEYLPESMQEYAYEIEPYGSWKRVYYRGYYYWAWKPHFTAVGWSPYSTGYWYDWHGSPVWMDHNSWGWITHHHGHWISLNGSWLWTPYVHVSHVPGVTVVGFNITFGRTYRPQWHPGRVRWISHNDYIGWFPLAPWETYYGYRRWGPGSYLVHDRPGISISINLSKHKHIDHAVIIPKQHLHKKGPVVVNNYNTVKIMNINNRVIVKDYKPILTVERERARAHKALKSAPGRNGARRNVSAQHDRKKTGKEMTRQARSEKRDEHVSRSQRVVQKERKVHGAVPRGRVQPVEKAPTKVAELEGQYRSAKSTQRKVAGIEKRVHRSKNQDKEQSLRRKIFRAKASPEKSVEKKAEQRPSEPKIQNQAKPVQRKSFGARFTSTQKRSRVTHTNGKQVQRREILPANSRTASRSKLASKNTTAAKRSDTKNGEQVLRHVTMQTQRKAARIGKEATRPGLRNDRKTAVARDREVKKPAQQSARKENNAGKRNGFREGNGQRQKGTRSWFSTSMNNRGMQ